MDQIVNRKNYVGISQPECRRKGSMKIDLVCSFFFMFLSQGLGFIGFLSTMIFYVL
jgi:hypothetical protein